MTELSKGMIEPIRGINESSSMVIEEAPERYEEEGTMLMNDRRKINGGDLGLNPRNYNIEEEVEQEMFEAQ